MVGENLQMNLKFVQSASDSSSSAQQPIVKKETMDVSTTDIVKDGAVLGNSSNNVNLGELSNPASNLVVDAVAPSLTLDSLSSVVEEAKLFRTVHLVKKPFLPLLPAIHPVPSFQEPPQKVSNIFTSSLSESCIRRNY